MLQAKMKNISDIEILPKHPQSDNPYYILVIWVVAVSLCSLILLSIHNFKSVYAILAGTFAAAGFIAAFRIRVKLSFHHWVLYLVVILLIASLFRAKPFLWVMGGQDQGVYVNMSEAYERNGSPFIIDNVREKLSSTSKILYDSTQHYNEIATSSPRTYPLVDIEALSKQGISNINVKYKLKYSMHLPAVYLKDMNKSEYVFGFYPMHPLWMAIFSKIVGSVNRVYSLVFFSIMSIVSFALLARELSSGSTRAGLFVAMLLSINPLHAFFAKFPVTETVALFFSSTGFYYLLKYIKHGAKHLRTDYLIISVGLFACMFFTRISSLIYLPIFYLMALWSYILCEHNDVRHKIIRKAVVALFLLYVLSVGYGLLYSYPYSMFFYEVMFNKALGSNWFIIISISVLSLIAILIAVIAISKRTDITSLIKLNRSSSVMSCLLIMLIVLWGVGAYKQISFSNDSKLFMTGFASTIAYISPVAFIILIYSLAVIVFKDSRIWPESALMVMIVFYCSAVIMKLKVPYHYYYARYLLTEIVPYTLLLVSLSLNALWVKKGCSRIVSQVCLAFMVMYFLFFTSFQLKGAEAYGAASALSKTTSNIGGNDLLLIGFDDLRITTPIKYYYNKNVYVVNKPSSVDPKLMTELIRSYGDIYLLCKAPINQSAFNLVNIVEYTEGQYEHVNRIPMKYYAEVNKQTFYLYRLSGIFSPSELVTQLKNIISRGNY